MTINWTNPSVLELAQGRDPVDEIQRAARQMVLTALENGWAGPPFDPFELAATLNCRVVPSQTVPDARLVPDGRHFLIEFNPSQPRRRVRFSIAHELAHTLFPDCHRDVRNRARTRETRKDEWQLEMLCNIAAAEILMPAGNLPVESMRRLSIDDLIGFQEELDVSMEAILLRVARLERRNCAVFVASSNEGRLVIDYAVETHGGGFGIESGLTLPQDSAVHGCTAIGYTAKGDEAWVCDQPLHVECVGIPGYPGQHRPRVAGIVYRKGDRSEGSSRIRFVVGSALQPHGKGMRVIAQIVNDQAATWGGNGIASAVRRHWPSVQSDFQKWASSDPKNLQLGQMHVASVDENTSVASMIAQHGYGPSRNPRIRYGHLRDCLDHLRVFATSINASVHMPRIGCGQAGGNWWIVQDLILDTLSNHGIDVTVYDLRRQTRTQFTRQQISLFENY